MNDDEFWRPLDLPPKEAFLTALDEARRSSDKGASMYTAVDLAKAVAVAAHAGQTDKAGAPYITHPQRVAANVALVTDDLEVIAAAWMHDVLEDSDMEASELLWLGFSPKTVQLVERLTIRPEETHQEAVRRAAADPDAKLIKRCDVADNANPHRLALLDEATRQRLKRKYDRALEELR